MDILNILIVDAMNQKKSADKDGCKSDGSPLTNFNARIFRVIIRVK